MVIVLSLLFASFLSLQPVEALNIYLNKVAIVDKPIFVLSDVATIVSSDTLHRSRFENLELDATPERLTLYPVRIIKERIDSRIEGQVIIIGSRIGIIPLELIPRKDVWFYQELLEYLDTVEADKSGRLELEIITFPHLPSGEKPGHKYPGQVASESVPPGEPVFKLLKFHKFQDHLVGEIEISYRIPGMDNYSGSLRAWIHHFLPVARAKKNLEPNQVLTEKNLYFVEEDISLSHRKYLLATDNPETFRITTRLAEGSLIYRSQLQRNMTIRAGDTLTITFLKPGLMIKVPGKALGSGIINDTIEVMPSDSRERFLGYILAAREVIVEIP